MGIKVVLQRIAVIVAVIVYFPNVGAVYGQDTTLLDEVVVTASRVKEKKKEVARNVQIISQDQIKNSAAKDLGELLAEMGVGYIKKYPGTLTSVGIRGFKTDTHGSPLQSHVLVLIDGRQAGTGNLAKILTKNVERIEIIRGPASVEYGSAALGGVINVITRRGKDKPSVFVEGMLGSFGFEETSIGFAGKLGKFDFSGSATRGRMDDYDTGEGITYHNTEYRGLNNLSLNLGFELFEGHRLGFIYHLFDVDHAGSPSYLSLNDLDDYSEKRNESLDFTYEGKGSGNMLSWKLRYFYGEDSDKWFDPTGSNPDYLDDGIPFETTTDQEGMQAQITCNWNMFAVTGGFDWINYEVESTLDPKRSEYDNPAYFLLAKARLFDERLVLTGGLRYDTYEVEVKEGQGREENDSQLTPNIGLAWMATENLKFRAAYGQGFMMPSAKQLAGDFGTWVHYVGNPDLDPEKSWTYEEGVDFLRGPLKLSGTYFYTKFKDKIQTTTTPSGDTTWENLGEAKIAGFEGDFSMDVGGFFDWPFEIRPYVNIVYLTEYRDEEADEDLKYISDKIISYGISISDGEGFSANLDLTYTGKQRIEDWESGWPAPVITKDGFTVANFTISKRVLDFAKFGKLTLKGQVTNLFDKDYSYVKGYPMPGRSFFLGLRYDY